MFCKENGNKEGTACNIFLVKFINVEKSEYTYKKKRKKEW